MILVGGLEHLLFSHSVGKFIIPIDDLIFFSGVLSTTNQDRYEYDDMMFMFVFFFIIPRSRNIRNTDAHDEKTIIDVKPCETFSSMA